MQHDLFHIYTVDAHTLQVIENMRKFALKPAIRFPLQLTFLRTYQKSNFSTLLVCTMTSQKVAAEIIASLENQT